MQWPAWVLIAMTFVNVWFSWKVGRRVTVLRLDHAGVAAVQAAINRTNSAELDRLEDLIRGTQKRLHDRANPVIKRVPGQRGSTKT